MNKDYTHITTVVDRSGSMWGVWDDVKGWYSGLIKQHRKADGKCTISTLAFDNEILELETGANVQKASSVLNAHPRSMTRLLDAVGKAIVSTDRYLKKMPKSRRPAKVLFMIQTDGLENDSREYSRDQIRAMIGKFTEEKNWDFMFLGANLDAVREAKNWGVTNTVNYSEAQTKGALELTTCKTLAARSADMETYKAAYVVTDDEEKSVQ